MSSVISEKLDLKRLMDDNEYQDNSEYIRTIKHSGKIESDICQFGYLKNLFFGSLASIDDLTVLSLEEAKKKQLAFEDMVKLNCSFIYTTYPDIYKKMMKDELDLTIMIRLVAILKQIEENKVNQHDASVQFGKVLKELFIDSAIKRGTHLDEEHKDDPENGKKKTKEVKKLSWSQYKKKTEK
jgi:hypothetical protein